MHVLKVILANCHNKKAILAIILHLLLLDQIIIPLPDKSIHMQCNFTAVLLKVIRFYGKHSVLTIVQDSKPH